MINGKKCIKIQFKPKIKYRHFKTFSQNKKVTIYESIKKPAEIAGSNLTGGMDVSLL